MSVSRITKTFNEEQQKQNKTKIPSLVCKENNKRYSIVFSSYKCVYVIECVHVCMCDKLNSNYILIYYTLNLVSGTYNQNGGRSRFKFRVRW